MMTKHVPLVLGALLLMPEAAVPLPPLEILEPDGLSQAEYATDVRGDSWDMDESTDVSFTANIANASWVGGLFSGIAENNDPWFQLSVPPGSAIAAARYRMLVLRIQVSQAGGCWVYWSPSQNPYQWHTYGPVQLSSGWNTVQLDLALAAGGDWAGYLPVFRIDPSTIAGVSFAVDDVALRMPDNGDSTFTIRWDDGDPPLGTLALYYDDDASGFDGTLIQAGLDAHDQADSLVWYLTGMPAGAYYVYGDLTDGLTHSMDYSANPLLLNDPPSMNLLTPDSTRVAEGEDYATTLWLDRMDMTEDRDIDRVHNVDGEALGAGTWRAWATTNDPELFLVNPPIISLDLHMRGHRPIDTQRYTRFSFRMFASQEGAPQHMLQMLWYDSLPYPSGTTQFFPVYKGWHTYSFDLANVQLLPPYTVPWQSSPKRGLRLDPTTAQGDTFALDWVRLACDGDPGSLLQIEWYAYDPDDQASIDLYYDPAGLAAPELIVSGLAEQDGYGSYTWNTAFLPPGVYYVFAEISDPLHTIVAYAPGPVLINSAPLLGFNAPSPAGQDDYATIERGDPWDLSEASDVVGTHDVSWWTVQDGILTGQTGGVDSWVQFALDGKLAAETYRHLSYHLWVEGPQDIGLGSVTKAYYNRDTPSGPVISGGGDCVIEEGWNTYTYDLTRIPLGPEIADTVGWADSISMFRLDIHEFTWPRIFHLDFVSICSADWGDTAFTIKWWDGDPDDDADISVYCDTDSSGFDGFLIATGISEDGAVDSLDWNVSALEGGEYFLYAIVDDGLNVLKRYACAPIRVDHPPTLMLVEPDGAFDVLPDPEDYADDVRGDAWDFSDPSDVAWIQELGDTSYAGGIFSGTVTGSPANVRLDIPPGSPVDASQYGIFACRMSLSQAAVMHFFWKTGGSWNNNTVQLPVYEDWSTYRVDLDSVIAQGAWAGQVEGFQVSIFFANNADLQLDWVTLTREGAFADTIRWTDMDLESDARIRLYFDTNQSGADGDLIAGSLSENSLVDTYLWDCSFLPAGVYYAYGIIDDFYNPPRISYSAAPFATGSFALLPPRLAIMRYGTQSVKLMWDYGGNPPSAVAGFAVYRSDRAHFETSPGSKIAEPVFPFYVNYAPEAVGNPNLNYYYRVTVRGTGGAESPASDVAGEFDFDLP
jgi:hypothetical protein